MFLIIVRYVNVLFLNNKVGRSKIYVIYNKFFIFMVFFYKKIVGFIEIIV